MRAARRHLARTLWPDKLMYGTIVLEVSGLVGALYALVVLAAGVDYEGAVPPLLATYPALATIVLSLLATLLGAAGFALRNTNHSLAGGVAGVAALGLLGAGSVASLVAIGLFLVARHEGEDTHHASLSLQAHMWPDKSLAASAVLFVHGLLTVAWGFLLGLGVVASALDGEGLPFLFVGIGAFLMGAAHLLHHQRAPVLGVLAALLGGIAFAFVVVGPLLTLVVLVLLGLAQREREFDPQAHPAGPPQEPASAVPTAGHDL